MQCRGCWCHAEEGGGRDKQARPVHAGQVAGMWVVQEPSSCKGPTSVASVCPITVEPASAAQAIVHPPALGVAFLLRIRIVAAPLGHTLAAVFVLVGGLLAAGVTLALLGV
jgi:hypothetical protein